MDCTVGEARREYRGRIIRKNEGVSQRIRRTRILLKTGADGVVWTDGKIAEVISPKKNRTFVVSIENLLKTYKTSCDKEFGLVCIDEQGRCSGTDFPNVHPLEACGRIYDNLNTHTMVYTANAFDLPTVDTSHAENIAECELSVMMCQYLSNLRHSTVAHGTTHLRLECSQFCRTKNFDWQSITKNVRIKLKSIHPQ